ncbi:MAG: tetratricopeptide repeat protein [bacterium]|nr:tetratricopeptide repeat protein [bacterium]
MKKRKRIAALLLLCTLLTASAGCTSKLSKQDYRMAGIEAMEAGSYEEAVTQFDEAIAHSNGFVGKFELDVLKYRGEAEFRMGDYASAAETYETLLEADGKRAEYWYALCMSEAKLGEVDAALAAFSSGQEMDAKASGADEALWILGDSLVEQQREEEALSLYEQVLASGEVSAALYNRLGLCYLEAAAYDRALECFTSGLEAVDAEENEKVDRTGDETETEGAGLQQQLLFNQAVAYEFAGDFQTARERMEAYVAAYPEHEEAQKELTFLQTR